MDTKKLRQKILDLAIRGKLVPQDPNDEPASVLLERIKAEKEKLIKEGKIKKSKQSASVDSSPYEKFADGTVKCVDEEIPFDLPKGWEWVRGDFAFLPMTSKKPKGQNFIYIDVDAINNTKNVIDNPKILPVNGAPSRANRQIHENDILFSMVRPYLKNIAMVTTDYCNAIASTGFYVITPSICWHPLFLFFVMLSPYVVDGLNQYMKGDNSPSINTRDIEHFLYPLAPYAEQQRIASEVERLFALIDEIEKGKASLEEAIKQAKRKVLELAVTGKLCNDNRHYRKVTGETRTFMLEELLDYEQPQSYIVKSTDYSDDYPIPVLTAGKSFILGRTDEKFGIYHKVPAVIFDDFTTDSKYVDFPFKVKSSAMKILKPKNNNICLRYIAAYMSITRLIGKTHKRYWISEYSKLRIVLPSYEEQLLIVNRIDEIFAVLDKIQKNFV